MNLSLSLSLASVVVRGAGQRPWWLSPDYVVGGVAPTLAFDFLRQRYVMRPASGAPIARNGALPAPITFSRASTGTYFDKFGVMRVAAADEARIDHRYNPATGVWESRGLLVEGQATNLLAYSEDFSAWTLLNVAAVAGAVQAPDGSMTGTKLQELGPAAVEHMAYLGSSAGPTNGLVVTSSVFAKAGERNQVQLAFSGFAGWVGGSGASVLFDLETGTAAPIEGSTPTSYGMTYAGDGWWRCFIVGTQSTAQTVTARVSLASGGTKVYPGTTDYGAYIWGFQLEHARTCSSYIPTDGAAATRAIDAFTISDLSSFGFNAEGLLTIVAQNPGSTGAYKHFASFLKASDSPNLSNSMRLILTPTGNQFIGQTRVAGTNYLNTLSTVPASGQAVASLGYKAADAVAAYNGTVLGTSATSPVPPVDHLVVGNLWEFSPEIWQGAIEQVIYHPFRPSNAAIQQLHEAFA